MASSMPQYLNYLYLLSFFTIFFFSPSLSTTTSTYSPKDKIFLSCGTSSSSTDSDGRTWIGDSGSNYLSSTPTHSYPPSHSYQPLSQDPSVPKTPFSFARVFTSDYTYTFPLSPGRYFLRLYFYPIIYSTHFPEDSYFSLTAGPYTLLSNFSAFITTKALNYAYIIREFSIEVNSTTLNLTFSPSKTHPNSFAFVNGIEIVSSPDIFNGSKSRFVYRDPPISYQLDQNMAVQTMYRLNVGGRALTPSEDSGLYRQWHDDSDYIYGAAYGVTFAKDPNVTIKYPTSIPEYIAPVDVYETARSMGTNAQINLNYNLTWIFSVDAGFYYLVRFHFCEIQYPITKGNQRVFYIYINNQTAQRQFDVIAFGQNGGIGVPVYEDYVVVTSGSGQMDMWIALHPDLSTKTEYYDAILNGLEIFKMGTIGSNNLAGLNPNPLPTNIVDPTRVLDMRHDSIAKIVCGVIGGILVISLSFLCVLLLCRRQQKKEVDSYTGKASDGTTFILGPLTQYQTSKSHSVGTIKDSKGVDTDFVYVRIST